VWSRDKKAKRERKRKNNASGGTIKGATKEGAGMLHKEKCTGEQDKVF